MINQNPGVAASSSQADPYNSPLDISWLPAGIKELISKTHPNGPHLADFKEQDVITSSIIENSFIRKLMELVSKDIKQDFFQRIMLARANPSNFVLTQQGILSYLLLCLCLKVGHTEFNNSNIHFEVDALLKNKNLARLELRCRNLEDLDFTDMDLSTIDFTGSLLNRAIFKGADLTASMLAHTELNEVIWDGAKLSGADFYQAQFGKLNLNTINLKDACLYGADFGEADFDSLQLKSFDTFQIDGAYLGERFPNYSFLSGRRIEDGFIISTPACRATVDTKLASPLMVKSEMEEQAQLNAAKEASLVGQLGSSASAEAGPAEGVASPRGAAATAGFFGTGSSATGKQPAAVESQNMTSPSLSSAPGQSSAPG